MSRGSVSLFALAALLGLAACSGPGAPALSRDALEARAAARPNDASAHLALGTFLARAQDLGPAVGALTRAVELDSSNGRALYVLGLTNEALGNPDAAEQAYARYLGVPAKSVYRDSLRGRLDSMVRSRLRSEFSAALLADSIASVSGTDAIGVLPFAYRGPNEEYAALGRGLAEVVSVDLASVEGLTVVERVRLEALLAELDLAKSGLTDPATAVRAGRLLRAESLVGGEYDVQGDALRIDAAVWRDQNPSLEIETSEGGVANLFAVQKRVTMSVLSSLGISVSQADLRRMSAVPTNDLAAFLLFSRGLTEEDDGDLVRAAELYQAALARDPAFSLAGQRFAEVGMTMSSSRPSGSVLGALAVFAVTPVQDVVSVRSASMSEILGGMIIPGVGSRTAVVDGNNAGILGRLPDPPPLPTENGGNGE